MPDNENQEWIDLLREILSELESMNEEELLIILNGVLKIRNDVDDKNE